MTENQVAEMKQNLLTEWTETGFAILAEAELWEMSVVEFAKAVWEFRGWDRGAFAKAVTFEARKRQWLAAKAQAEREMVGMLGFLKLQAESLQWLAENDPQSFELVS